MFAENISQKHENRIKIWDFLIEFNLFLSTHPIYIFINLFRQLLSDFSWMAYILFDRIPGFLPQVVPKTFHKIKFIAPSRSFGTDTLFTHISCSLLPIVSMR